MNMNEHFEIKLVADNGEFDVSINGKGSMRSLISAYYCLMDFCVENNDLAFSVAHKKFCADRYKKLTGKDVEEALKEKKNIIPVDVSENIMNMIIKDMEENE